MKKETLHEGATLDALISGSNNCRTARGSQRMPRSTLVNLTMFAVDAKPENFLVGREPRLTVASAGTASGSANSSEPDSLPNPHIVKQIFFVAPLFFHLHK